MGLWRQSPQPATPRAPTLPPSTATPPAAAGGHWEGGGQWRPRRWVSDATPPPVTHQPTPGGPGAGGLGPIAAQPAPAAPSVSAPPGITMPQPAPQQPMPGGVPSSGANGGFGYGDYNDPYNAYLASIPVMENQMNHQIGQAMAQAGFGGNRWSSSAENQAGQIGAETSLKMNEAFNRMMFEQSNRDLDRAYGTAGQYMQLGGMEDASQQARLAGLQGYGQWEQGRQDQFANTAMNNFNQDRLGYLPYLTQFGGAQGTPSGGTPYQVVTNPGSQASIPPELLAALLGKLF